MIDSCPDSTPWGHADVKERLAPGIWSVSTPGHGGIWINQSRRHSMPAPYHSFTSVYGDISLGFYEEDCDWVVPVLAFAAELEFNPRGARMVAIARQTLDHDKTSGRNYFAAIHTRLQVIPSAVEFNENDCSGAFDGFTVTSDADPGL